MGDSSPIRHLSLASGIYPITRTQEVRDLGVVVTSDFKPSSQCQNAASRARSALHRLRHVVTSREAEVFLPLYNALVRPHSEYCVHAWCPYLKKDIVCLEKVQKLATRQIVGMKGRSYEERLIALGLFSLERRRLRGDLIESWKYLQKMDDPSQVSFFKKRSYTATRGHEWTLYRERSNKLLRANFFSQRVVDAWNRLPQELVAAMSSASFKVRLDRVWVGLFPDLY